ncbi:hypothetical protein L596_028288 [Steinernema carpocapsae]|uniref:Uncharacterized protein n=1 Tax=Steinernema carpocapsae TaxID=34508 RepID=A0A4V5ZY11_STECR|nr:hypothetical protein L596_028288 [Steinernema carpocapsae]
MTTEDAFFWQAAELCKDFQLKLECIEWDHPVQDSSTNHYLLRELRSVADASWKATLQAFKNSTKNLLAAFFAREHPPGATTTSSSSLAA